MDESGIEATQALDFVDDGDDTDEDIDLNTPVAYLNVGCQKGFPGKLFPIFEGDNVIGRHDGCQVAIPLKALSREHACIEVKTGSHFIYDKGSRNRTRRNTHFLAAAVRYELKDKDKLIFGDVECEFQLQAVNNDDGSETESESMFQTAPDDEVPVDDVDEKPLDEEDYHSDASSDILEPTQPFTKNTQSMLGTKSQLGETTIAQNITVEDTPASNRSKKFTGNVVIPESGSDTDGEEEMPKDTLETSAETSRLLVAETQSYVCESDITTDDEDNVGNKSSLLVAPTQAFIQGDDDDDDVSTCSETSPKKKHLMMAATQAYVGDSDDNVSPRKKLMLEPTQAYNMDVGVEPTQDYDMDGEDDSDTAEMHTEDEEQKQSGILFEPTQAYVSNDQGAEEGDGNVSESSEEFAETVDFDVATQAVENVPSDDKESKSAAVTEVCDTQVFEEQSADVGTKSSVPISDTNSVETQVFEEVSDVTEKNNKKVAEMKNEENITQGFDKHTDSTQTFSEEDGNTFDFLGTSTLAVDTVDSEESCESTDRHSANADIDQATQVFDNTDETCMVTDDLSDTDGDKRKQCPSKKVSDLEAATQVFNDTVAVQEDATVALEDTDVRSCSKELKSGRKSKVINKSKKQSIAETVPIVHGEEQTQVFDETVAVEEILEVIKPTESDKKLSKKIFDNSVKQSTTEESTQVFDETVPVDEMTEVTKPAVKANAKTHTTEESTQIFDETVAIEEIPEVSYPVKGGNEKQSTSEEPTQVFDETIAVEETPEEIKPTTKYNDEIHTTEGPTQVFDETIAVEEITEVIKPTAKHKNEIHTTEGSTEGPTQVFDATVAVEEIPEAIKPKRGGKKGPKKTSKQNIEQLTMEEPTQVFDETMAVESTEQTVEPESKSNNIKKLNPQSKEFEETDAKNTAVNETGDKISTRKGGRRKQSSAANTDMSDNVETSNNARTGRSRTRRNRTTNNDNDDASKSEELKTTKTDAVKKNANVRKSGRNSSKVEANDTKEKQTDNVRKSVRNRKNAGKNDEDNAQMSNSVVKENRNGKKEESNQEIGDTEAATQNYADDDPADAAATQRYGDDDDEDLTPDIDTVLAEEANQINIPVVETVIPSKSPLKSALASPKKERSPSPKKVQFVSQKSETESESNENTRRSKRSNKGKAKVNLDFEAEENKPVSRNKKQKEEKHVEAADAMPEVSEVKEDKGKSTRKGKRGVKSQEPAKENETVYGIVEKASDSVPVTSRRKGKLVNSNSGVKQENEGKIEETKVKSKIDNTSKVARRGGRRSTNSNVEVKQETSRVTRTSLPNVLEHKLADNKTVKGNRRASKRKTEMTNTSEENDDKQIVSDGVKKEPSGSRSSKRQNKDEDSESVKNCEETEETESKNSENIDVRPSRRGSRHKELKVKESDSVVNKSENTKSDTKKSGVKTVKESDSVVDTSENTKSDTKKSGVKTVKSKTIEADEKNSNENEIKRDVTVVNRKGKRVSAVSNSKSESDSRAVEVQEKGSRNKRSSRRNAGDDGDSATDKTIDKSEVKKEDEVVETKKSTGQLKRKNSASSSNDSQEGKLGETPAKRQRRGKAPVLSTPVSSNKQKSVKQLEESVSNSPTLRKTTIEGVKAKVMFTGVVDEQGQKIVKELGGELVNSVMDCTHLVTDQVRRTVKFLCCLARGIPIVVPQWLISSKASGFFVDSAPFLVTDEASERKFKFRLDQSIDKASKDRMFNGYIVHVTKSVKPEPAQMKDILKCAGAKYCDTMPASITSGQVVVVSCIDDQPLCTPAVKAGIPVMSAEFILTGILRQDVDLVSFKLDINAQGNKRSLPESHTETSKKRKR